MERDTHEALRERIRKLEAQLVEAESQHMEAEETLLALRSGRVDAVIAAGPGGDRVYTLEGADETYRVFLEEMAEGALTLMRDGLIVFSNPKFPAMVGLPMEQVVGSRIQEFLSDEGAAELPVFLNRARIESQKQEFRLVTQAGTTVPVYIAASYCEHGDLECLCAVVTDLTDEKRTKQALKAAEVIRESEEYLRIANEDLKQFTFAAAHDLREPLRNIRAYTELLLKSIGTSPDGDIDRMKAVIVEGVERMEELLRDLLDYAQLTARQDDQDGVTDTSIAITKAVANLQIVIQASSAEVSWGPLPSVRGREQNYVQLFQNLLGNAIKYRGPQAPQIAIAARRQADEWVFSVRDNGIGIEPQYRVQIFGLFKRLHGKDIPGTGIGLAICQKIVERNGGRIWVESELGKGAEFLFTLRTAGVDKATLIPEGSGADSGKKRILVIDDNSADTFLLEHALKDAALDCVIVGIADGEQAENYIRRSEETPQADLIVLDLNLPRVGGIQLLRLIRECSSFDGVPVIVWTSSMSPKDKAALEEFHPTRFFVKPSSFEGFMEVGSMIRDVMAAKHLV